MATPVHLLTWVIGIGKNQAGGENVPLNSPLDTPMQTHLRLIPLIKSYLDLQIPVRLMEFLPFVFHYPVESVSRGHLNFLKPGAEVRKEVRRFPEAFDLL